MGVERPGETPVFFSYAVRHALVGRNQNELPVQIRNFTVERLYIPPYQRKIVWNKEKIIDLLESESVLFGTVIMANTSEAGYLTLLDGLQRFAVSTALIHYIHELVTERPDLTHHFQRLENNVGRHQAIIQHNHDMLLNHQRSGISNSYREVYSVVKLLVDEKSTNSIDEFARKIDDTFNVKQIAIDRYGGFINSEQLTQTFIHINSTGMDLNDIDLLRSGIVIKAELNEWTNEDIDGVENDFTEIFSDIKNVQRLFKHLYEVFKIDDNGKRMVFQNWDNLDRNDVSVMLNYIREIYTEATSMHAENHEQRNRPIYPYLYEIYQCGPLPFALAAWYFYVNRENIDFHNAINEQRLLLRIFYRWMIEGNIGRRLGATVKEFIMQEYSTIGVLTNAINRDNFGGLDAPNEEWLKVALRRSDVKNAKSIFNACLLPERNDDAGEFAPLTYGRRNTDWNIDHLIPTAAHQDEQIGVDINSLVNLAPLPANINVLVRDGQCSEKLSNANAYRSVMDRHPYIQWLCETHFNINQRQQFNELNCLVLNHDTHIGDQRIDRIIELLVPRL